MIFRAEKWDVDGLWLRVAPLLQKALARQTERSLDGIYRELHAERMQLWVVPWDMAVVTQVQRFENAHLCMIVLCGGEHLEEHKHEFDSITAWCKAIGCDELRIVGRPGWERVFPQFKQIGTILRADT